MDFYLFDDQAEAVKYAKALNNSSLYTASGAPALPRCEHPKWLGRSIPAGRKRIARERCRSRTQVSRDCPHVTWAHADVTRTSAGKLAILAAGDDSARGETVDIDGETITLDRPRVARSEDDVEQDTLVWRGERPAG